MSEKPVIVSGGFDDLRSRQVRFLQEAAKFGPVTVLLWPDEILKGLTGSSPKLPLAERLYFLSALHYVSRVVVAPAGIECASLPMRVLMSARPGVWADEEESKEREAWCQANGIDYRVIGPERLAGFPANPPASMPAGRKKVVVTGCYDWLHTGHVRFFEEVSGYGDVFVVVGHDVNIKALKGEGHPLLPENERRYMVGAVKYVHEALITSGDGWLDADPEIRRLKPDIYAVNEDGDRGGKREYCEKLGIQYLVLKRVPAPGLPKRSSTDLRGF